MVEPPRAPSESRTMLAAALLALAATPASAAERPDVPALTPDDQRIHDRLLDAYDSHFDPAQAEEAGDGFTCLTGLVAELKQNWHVFSAEERAEMTAQLAPWKVDLLDPAWVEGDAPPPPGSPCFGYYYDNYVDGEYHSVQWEDGAITNAQANAFLESLEYSYAVEVEEQGWWAPNRIDTYAMMVLVTKGGGGGAYTTVDRCGNSYLPYVVAQGGSFAGASGWYRTMAAHEFNHASQYAYGMAHEFWWWEAAASYAQEFVYPDPNDWSDFVSVYRHTPHVGLNAWAGNSNDSTLFYHTYAMALWGFYLDENHGGMETVQATWELAAERGSDSYGYDYWMPDTVTDLGLDFDEVWTGFMATNAVMAYRESEDMPWPSRTDEIDVLPASGGDDARLVPQSLGMAFITFDPDVAEEGKALRVGINGQDGPDWYGVLVVGDDAILARSVVEFDENGEGIGVIDFIPGEPVQLVLSPVDPEASGYRYDWTDADGFGFSWSADVVDAAGTDPPSDGDEDDEAGGLLACGCANTGPASVPLALGLFGFLVAARRRRD
jgi:hypothetical protein